MVFKYNNAIVNDGNLDCQSFENCNCIGYLNKTGQLIDCSMPFGLGGHDCDPITNLFVNYFYIRDKRIFEKGVYVFEQNKELTGEEYEKYICEDYREVLKETLKIKKGWTDSFKKNLGSSHFSNPYNTLEQDLIKFFINCYQNDSFITGFGKDYYIMNEEEFYHSTYYQNILRNNYQSGINNTSFNFIYSQYKNNMVLKLFKDTVVQYLGYHSIERIPKTITTSEIKIYSTFYNYMLNDFTIVRIPKMSYDEEQKMYVEHKQSDFLLPDSEVRLKEEIQSIKRLVPIKDGIKYFR